MTPSVMIDESPDFLVTPQKTSITQAEQQQQQQQQQQQYQQQRTLLLAPPSLSAHPEALSKVMEKHDRSSTDMQMLDRLALGMVSLPAATYDVILLLTDVDGSRTDSQGLVGREVIGRIVQSLKAGGRLRSQDGSFGSVNGPEKTEAILAGLILDDSRGGGMMKPEDAGVADFVPLKLRSKKQNTDAVPLKSKRKEVPDEQKQPAGVGFVDFGDDLDIPIVTGEDDELIDEDDLLNEEDLKQGLIQPPECRPKAGKRRRACKDCTCGLKEKLETEDAEKRGTADKALNTMKLGSDELTEVDFTIQGKVGSCGNCALGDAFRCDGCPYIGLPAFKPGQEVRLLNDDVQL